MASNIVDPEKGIFTTTVRSATPSRASSAPENADINDSGKSTPLRLFQLLIGLHTPQSLKRDDAQAGRYIKNIKSKLKSAPTGNVGLYQRAKQEERINKRKYLHTSHINSSLYMVQILLAATFTALSAYKDSHPVTLTILGAINTVLAGCLAWQKGQGVPNRYRKARDEYQALVLEIENAERSFVELEHEGGESGIKLDPRAETARLQRMFDIARANQQANYPDLYVSTTNTAAATKSSNDSAEAAKTHSEMKATMEALLKKLEGKIGAHAEAAVQSVTKENKQ